MYYVCILYIYLCIYFIFRFIYDKIKNKINKRTFKSIFKGVCEVKRSLNNLINIDNWIFFPYNGNVVLFNFSSPCTLLYPFGYMPSEVGQKECENTFINCVSRLSFNFPILCAGRKTILVKKLEEKTVHLFGLFDVQNKLIGLSNTKAKAYKYVGLIFVFLCCNKKSRLFKEMNYILFFFVPKN